MDADTFQTKEILRVEQFERIRRDRVREGLSIRSLADRHGVHRRTVRQALDSPVPPVRKTHDRPSSQMGPFEDIVRGWLTADLDVHRKQRHTARRVWQRLVDEHGAMIGESTVRRFVAEVKAEMGSMINDVMVVQDHVDGFEAEVDFGDIWATIGGVDVKVFLFVMRLSSSGRAFHAVYAHQASEAFLEGHVAAFDHFGGIPARIRYDNLKPAVTKVMIGRDRVENERFILLRSHYGFDSFFCAPGIDGAHEKGGVEGEVGRFRRRWMVPVPDVATLVELSGIVTEAMLTDDGRHIAGRVETVGQAFERERVLLSPLPAEAFDPATSITVKVDSKSRVCVRQCHYSVPAGIRRSSVNVKLFASEVHIIVDGKVVGVHQRCLHKCEQSLLLDHYLEVITRKPGALASSVTLAQARRDGTFTTSHEDWWHRCRVTVGDRAGTVGLCQVLLLARRYPTAAIIGGLDVANRLGSTEPNLVEIETRRIVDNERLTVTTIPASSTTIAEPLEETPEVVSPGLCLDRYDSLIGAA